MLTQRFHGFYPSLVGLLLGLLQIGLFFQLTFTLSSGFSTFLMVTLCWLLGSASGVLYAARLQFPTNLFLTLTLMAYFACAILLGLLPFNTALWPLYACLIVVSGLYPGVFFARMSQTYRTGDLFFRENNGFIVGLLVGTVVFMLLGRIALWVLPILVTVLIVLIDHHLKNDR